MTHVRSKSIQAAFQLNLNLINFYKSDGNSSVGLYWILETVLETSAAPTFLQADSITLNTPHPENLIRQNHQDDWDLGLWEGAHWEKLSCSVWPD